MNTCPYCGAEAENVWEEIEHMNANHPDIIADRLGHAGLEHLAYSKREIKPEDKRLLDALNAIVERVAAPEHANKRLAAINSIATQALAPYKAEKHD